jgi:4-hydroxyphenylpyruvate dioxygenase
VKSKARTNRHKFLVNGACDFLPLQGTDYVEFYVGNAKQAAHFYKPRSVSSARLFRTGNRVKDRASYAFGRTS